MCKIKIRAAAFSPGGTDWKKLFRFYDRDNSQSISLREFMSLMRRDATVASAASAMSHFGGASAEGGGQREGGPRRELLHGSQCDEVRSEARCEARCKI